MATKSGVWRGCLSDLLLSTGMLLLLSAALIWARNALAAQESANRRYLAASVPLALPLPEQASSALLLSGLPSPTPASPKEQATRIPQATFVQPKAVQPVDELTATPTADSVYATPSASPTPLPGAMVSSTAVVTEALPDTDAPQATATPVTTDLPPSNPIVHLEIPSLKVKRAVVPIGMRPDGSGAMSWDTDAIFATNNRPDLVGHLVGSAYPGQGGNVILVGHNYNQVDYGWEGVFVDIKTLQPGDRIMIRGEDGREYTYVVQQVKQVPWRSQNAKELEKHLKFLGPVKSERLTLVTCGGANIWPFPARVYVIAIPETP